ncbi:MAG: hypothetical protein ACJASV_002636 [Pseudorhodobacter sp.]|jgi:hypothetical protein
MILWGDKYDVALVNRLLAAISRHASSQPRFVLLSDRDRPGLDVRAQLRRIPDHWLLPVFKKGGCQTKLSMFEAGMLEVDLPAVYIDLDTVVSGDLARAADLLPDPKALMLLQSAILPLGRVGRLIWRLSKGKRYARGNSSLVVFHPKYHMNIAAQYLELWKKYEGYGIRPMIADERFMSWSAQEVVEAIPSSFAVKFPTEFMSRLTLSSYILALLPWVRSRRDNLVAVTLCGFDVKPETLLTMPEGGTLRDNKGRKLIWSDFILGRTRQRIIDFYQAPNA